jgi:phage terminase large subunit-like protein
MKEMRFDFIPWQLEAMQSKSRFKTVVAGRRCGKTRFSVVNTIIKGLECPAKDAGVMYVAPTQGMARVLCWNLLMELGGKAILKSNVNNGEIVLINGVTIYVRGADSPDSLRGMKLYHVTLDEMQMMKDSVWELIIRPALSDMQGTALFIGTPTPGDSLFREYFERGLGDDQEWKSWHLTTYDNPLISRTEIEAAKNSMSTMAFLQEYMASFDTLGSDIFKEEWFKYGDVSDPNKKKHLDDTAIAVVKITDDGNWWVKKVDCFRKDVRETAVRILMAIRTYKPIMIGIESGSLMRAVMPYLKDLMNKNAVYCHIEPIKTSGLSKKGSDAIANRVIWNLQGRFEHGRITFSNRENFDKLKKQLLMFPNNKVHDDAADALSLIAYLHDAVYSKMSNDDEYEVLDEISGI